MDQLIKILMHDKTRDGHRLVLLALYIYVAVKVDRIESRLSALEHKAGLAVAAAQAEVRQ